MCLRQRERPAACAGVGRRSRTPDGVRYVHSYWAGSVVPKATVDRRRLGPEFSSHSHTDLHSTTGTTPLPDTRSIVTYQHLIARPPVVKNNRGPCIAQSIPLSVSQSGNRVPP